MTFVRRLLRAHSAATLYARNSPVPAAAAPVTSPPLVPDIFAGTLSLCDEIGREIDQANRFSADLRAARSVGDLAAMEAAAAGLSAALATASRIGGSLCGVMQWHRDHLARQGGFICCENDPDCRVPCPSHPWSKRP
jgi:hypothetical protein